jgi:DNA-binding NtrC family response regulator
MPAMMRIDVLLKHFQTGIIKYALIINGGNIRKTAQFLGKNPTTMQRWVTICDLDGFARSLRFASNAELRQLIEQVQL